MDKRMGPNFWAAVCSVKNRGGKVGEALYSLLCEAADQRDAQRAVNDVLVDLDGYVRDIIRGVDADRRGNNGNASW